MAQARRNFGSALICGRNPAGRHGVSTESGSDRVKADSNNRDCQDYYPVATALGTDFILKLGHYPLCWPGGPTQPRLKFSQPHPARISEVGEALYAKCFPKFVY